jgi:hypothetical protein
MAQRAGGDPLGEVCLGHKLAFDIVTPSSLTRSMNGAIPCFLTGDGRTMAVIVRLRAAGRGVPFCETPNLATPRPR